MSNRMIVLGAVMSLLFDVGTAQGGAKGTSDSAIVIRAKLVEDLSSEYFGYFDLEIKNNTDQWIVLKNVSIAFPDSLQNANIGFVTGDKFQQWQRVIQKKLALSELNKNTSLAVIGAIGYGLAAFSGNNTMQGVGALAAGGAGGTYAVGQYAKQRDSLKLASQFPENHLLADSIVVLPGLSESRWLLINSWSHKEMKLVDRIFVQYESGSAGQQRKELPVPKSAWQKSKWWNPSFGSQTGGSGLPQ